MEMRTTLQTSRQKWQAFQMNLGRRSAQRLFDELHKDHSTPTGADGPAADRFKTRSLSRSYAAAVVLAALVHFGALVCLVAGVLFL